MSWRGSAFVAVFLLLTVGVGAVVFLTAIDVIPTDDREFGAPRWIVAAIGIVFVAMGLYPVATPWLGGARNGLLGGAFALLFVTVAGVFLTWATLADAPGRGGLAVGGLPIPLPAPAGRWLARGMTGLCALLLDTLAVIAWWTMGRHAWRALARTRPP